MSQSTKTDFLALLLDNAHFIDSLQVAQQYQHKLLGYRLVKTMLAQTTSSPAGQYIRCCVFENNPAQQLYFSAGFEEVSRSEGILRLQIAKDQLVRRFKLNESALHPREGYEYV